jgi:putative ABC transport system permease protein
VNILAHGSAVLRQAWTTTRFALKRLLTQRLLSLAAILGLMIASGFIFSIPLYADAIYFRLFREELFAGRETLLEGKPVDYAPLPFIYDLQGVGRGNPQWEDVGKVDSYLSKDALLRIGLPVMQDIRRFHTDFLYLYPPGSSQTTGGKLFVDTVRLAFVRPMENTVQIIHGAVPKPSSSLGGGSIEALVSETLALKKGIQVGDSYTVSRGNAQIPVSIVGIWRPVDPAGPCWDVTSDSWLLVDEESYSGSISSVLSDELFSSRWSITFDGSRLFAADIAGLISNIHAVGTRAALLLPQTKLVSSPLDALGRYQKNTPSLTFLLFAFSVPILGLILVFIGLVTGLFVGQQRSEMAILRSRGASRLQVAWISLLQGILLGAGALLGGIPLGLWIAHAIGRAFSFLNFTGADGLRVGFTFSVLEYGILGIALILLAQILFPTLSAAANTIVTYKQERARLLRPPWWQRFGLDALLIVPAVYGFWVMQQQSRLALKGGQNVPNPLQNPLLLLVPAIGIFAVSLLALRLIPILMAILSRVLRATKNVGMLMAARYLSRSPAFYTAPLILLILTLGLSAFTASLARTLDSQLEKQMSYQVGSDLQISELGTTANIDPANPTVTWTFPPVEEHLLIKGVRQATRIGRYPATSFFSDGAVQGMFLGVDRTTFPLVAYWQNDFASQPLGALMNALGATPDGVLVPTQLMSDKKLQIGDPITLSVSPGTRGESVAVTLRIVGGFTLFPTWYPTTGTLFVGNLDSLYLQAGSEYPHEVWLRTAPGADPESIVYAVRGYSIMLDENTDQTRLVENGLNTFVKSWSSAEQNIRAQQKRPERQGLFGLLSAGFVASALLTVLGFVLYALFSFRRRFIEMGMLRAIGLSVRQMVGLLAAELASLVVLGIGFGTVFGVLTSRLFVPFLQVGATAQAQYPPFQIQIAWGSIFEIYILFFALFLIALGALAALLVRMKIFQAIKLGEAL